mmetsp:Transcript_15496/g.13536  ORF Transcript_15496/g.13536 Transcript_15496/m.13536 type:complete len:185 (-) Transcript_15496:50-604(-)
MQEIILKIQMVMLPYLLQRLHLLLLPIKITEVSGMLTNQGRKHWLIFQMNKIWLTNLDIILECKRKKRNKFKLVKKLTTNGSGIKLTPLKPQELTDSSLESNHKIKQQKTITSISSTPKIIKSSKPIDVSQDVLSDSEDISTQLKVAKFKSKVKRKTKLFSRGKGAKKDKAQRIGKLVSYIEIY